MMDIPATGGGGGGVGAESTLYVDGSSDHASTLICFIVGLTMWMQPPRLSMQLSPWPIVKRARPSLMWASPIWRFEAARIKWA